MREAVRAWGWLLLGGAAGCGEAPPLEPDGALEPAPFGLRLPLEEPERFYQVVGVDHDPEVQEGVVGAAICTDYLGRAFPWCYDEHEGVDFLLEGGFAAMDSGSTEVVAASSGVVRAIEDGHYDRCRAVGTGIDCDGHPMIANFVILDHPSGFQTRYWHLKTGSVAVEVGQEVECGEVLGRVGSSGYSSMPHLHFEVHDPEGAPVDPYAGPYSQPRSLWTDQGEPKGLPGVECSGS